jgi:hypothetical protein
MEEEIRMSIPFFKKAAMVFLLVNVLACKALNPTPKADAADIEREEQAVYSYFVGSGNGPAVLLQDTATDISNDDPQKTLDYVKSGLPGVSKETLNNYLDRNDKPSQLSPNMQLGVEYVLLSADEQQAIFNQPGGWDAFYKKYPNAGGYTALSRVGFNNSLDQALIYVANMGGPLMGAGYYYLLEKKDGEWRIIEQVMVWIS